MTDLRTAAQQLLGACEQRLPLKGQAELIDELNNLRAALAEPDDSLTAAYMLGSYDAKQAFSQSKQLAEAGFTRRPSLWALEAREALELIAAPMRPDGTWNRDREACRRLAAEVLGRPDPEY